MADLVTEELQLLHSTTTRFIESELPLAATRQLHDDPIGFEDRWLEQTAELGWYSMLVAEEDGGGSVTGDALVDLTVIADSTGRFVQPGPFIPMNVVAAAVSTYGTQEQKADLLPGMIAGRHVASWAPFDEHGNWDEGQNLTVAIDGDTLVLTGARGLVQDAARADHILVAGMLDGNTVQLVVPRDLPGMHVEPLQCFDLAHRMAEVRFDRAQLRGTAMLGDGVDQRAAFEHQLQVAVVLACAETVGAIDAMFTMTVEYAKSRIAFGRPIGSFQALKHVMADMALYLEGCKAVTDEAARTVEARAADAPEVVSMAASYVDERANEIAQQSLQIHGGIGFTWEHDLHLLMRRTRFNTSLWCDQLWHRERICEVYGL